MRPMSHAHIIARFGGIRPMARLLDKPSSTVKSWESNDLIPAQHHQLVLDTARANGIALEPADFFQRPDGAETEAPAAQTAPPDQRDPITVSTPLDDVIRHLVRDGLLSPEAEGYAPRTFCKVPGQRWRRLPDSEAPPMDARIIRTEWNGKEWAQTFDSHEPAGTSEEAA